MIAFHMVWSALLASLLLLLLAPSASPVDAFSPPEASLTGGQSLSKRSLFDPSCTGVFDRQLLRRLGRVCDDCFNVFREPNVAMECRSNCYNNPVFRQCMEYLLPAHLHDEYRLAVQMVGK
uniref:Crustacean hyperglycemic hormones 2 n=1 Tax=Penaeus japonicus TaxID=27405 RepID=CHH2_PENJP|nr:RecName: Full=Crustacean hyperglycemic hormones 2; AltName: Full=Pej-SGP-II; Contains: RecName: Full=CHH precursor-related peptide 2; Short=CPRP 2; Contains: RecName: Full=Crustacean hyperglycemic hormone 2; Short=CHH 2; Flags: Precursor [Penaeus japonicus]BAA88339.1 hyperglycemic hormone [Penaeus japonicus]